MLIQQREIVEVDFPLPDGTYRPHPVIVLSNSNIIEHEDAFVCVMITSQNYNDEYTFRLSNEMLTKPMIKPCQVRCHLITMVRTKFINKHHGSIKLPYFELIIKQINTSLFGIKM